MVSPRGASASPSYRVAGSIATLSPNASSPISPRGSSRIPSSRDSQEPSGAMSMGSSPHTHILASSATAGSPPSVSGRTSPQPSVRASAAAIPPSRVSGRASPKTSVHASTASYHSPHSSPPPPPSNDGGASRPSSLSAYPEDGGGLLRRRRALSDLTGAPPLVRWLYSGSTTSTAAAGGMSAVGAGVGSGGGYGDDGPGVKGRQGGSIGLVSVGGSSSGSSSLDMLYAPTMAKTGLWGTYPGTSASVHGAVLQQGHVGGSGQYSLPSSISSLGLEGLPPSPLDAGHHPHFNQLAARLAEELRHKDSLLMAALQVRREVWGMRFVKAIIHHPYLRSVRKELKRAPPLHSPFRNSNWSLG